MNERELVDLSPDPTERAALEELIGRVRRLDPAPLSPVPADLRGRTLAAVSEAAAEDSAARTSERPSARATPRRRWRWPAVAGAGLAVAAVAAALAVVLGSGGQQGTLEADTRLAGRGGAATVQVREIGIGRTVDLRSGSLAILPKSEYYEVWFVGPGDAPGRPNRISAGTFHPDTEGRSDVQLKAAVDPRRYPRMEVTAEPGDGDPRATGKVVLAARLPLKR